MFKGIDVSYAQGSIDWEKVRAAGVEFAIIRAGYGYQASATDRFFAQNVAGCTRNKIPYGFYHYSYALSPAEGAAEATKMLEIIRGSKPEYPVWMDFEEKAQTALEPAAQLDIIEAFLSELEKAGYYAGVYSYKYALDRLRAADVARLERYDVWSAQWSTLNSYFGAHGVWQYSSEGQVDGIAGKVDLNYAYKDYPAIIRAAGRNGLTSSPEQSELERLRSERDSLKRKLASIEAVLKS